MIQSDKKINMLEQRLWALKSERNNSFGTESNNNSLSEYGRIYWEMCRYISQYYWLKELQNILKWVQAKIKRYEELFESIIPMPKSTFWLIINKNDKEIFEIELTTINTEIELAKKHTDKSNIINLDDDIVFNLKLRTLKVWEMEYNNIDKKTIDIKNVLKKTKIILALLYAIVREYSENKNNCIYETFDEYTVFINIYKERLGIKGELPNNNSFRQYRSWVKTLLKKTNSIYEIKKEKKLNYFVKKKV